MSFLHFLHTLDQEHQKLFHKVPIVGFRRAKSLKDILVRPNVLPVKKNENVLYLFKCKTCSKQYTGSTEDFRPRFNNCRCVHRNLLKGKKVNNVEKPIM